MFPVEERLITSVPWLCLPVSSGGHCQLKSYYYTFHPVLMLLPTPYYLLPTPYSCPPAFSTRIFPIFPQQTFPCPFPLLYAVLLYLNSLFIRIVISNLKIQRDAHNSGPIYRIAVFPFIIFLS